VNLHDSVHVGDVVQNVNVLSDSRCPICSATNVRVMRCSKDTCTIQFCEICHPINRFVGFDEDGAIRVARFDSGQGDAPLCKFHLPEPRMVITQQEQTPRTTKQNPTVVTKQPFDVNEAVNLGNSQLQLGHLSPIQRRELELKHLLSQRNNSIKLLKYFAWTVMLVAVIAAILDGDLIALCGGWVVGVPIYGMYQYFDNRFPGPQITTVETELHMLRIGYSEDDLSPRIPEQTYLP
jgi:hypothetical protein